MNFEWKLLFFCSETRVSEQNIEISDEKRAFLSRIQRFLMKNMRF